MKRDAYGDDGPMQKRSRQTDDEVTFLIPSKVAGSIIGKGGANITKLRTQVRPPISYYPLRVLYLRKDPPLLTLICQSCRDGQETYFTEKNALLDGCSVHHRGLHGGQSIGCRQNNPPAASYRVLSILADDVETVLEIVKDVLPNLADSGPNKSTNADEDLDVRLLIHQSRAGCVIGKGGAKIKELREKTGARLKIFSNPAPQSTERVVQLVGKADSVAAGVREVLELVRQVPIKGPVQAYDPHNYDDFYAEEYGGYGVGQGGPVRARGPPPRSAPPLAGPPVPPRAPRGPMGRPPPPRPPAFDYPPNLGPHPHGPHGGPGGPGGSSMARGFSGPPGGAGRGAYGGGYGGYGGGRGGPPAPQGFPPGNPGGPQETSTQVTIPKDLAGAIIGKAGSRIRKIRQESGAGIEIAEPLPGSNDRIITITGSPQRIQMAQYLLQQSVHESNPNLGRGNY